MVCHHYDSGNFVISPYDEKYRVFFILSGAVRACTASSCGKPVYFEDLRPGTMFGELAVIDGGSRTSDCIAIADSCILSLSDKQFLQLLDNYPAVNRAVLLRMAAMLRYQLQRVYEFTSFNVNQRIRLELVRLAADQPIKEHTVSLNQVPTHYELAERVSAHREAVCKELRKLTTAGYITWTRREHIIHDLPKLLLHASEK